MPHCPFQTTAGQSLAVAASDIYLDMQEASELIAKTRGEINRAQLMEQLNQSFGSITPEMQQVVVGVKGILFGESEAGVPIASRPPSSPHRATAVRWSCESVSQQEQSNE